MTTKPKHTPGPWLITDGDFVYSLHERNGRQVNRFSAAIDHYPSQGGTAEEGRANTRLIAAAPDLLEALKAILSDEMRDHKAVYEFGGFVLPDELRNQAAAAIAKAEGRSE